MQDHESWQGRGDPQSGGEGESLLRYVRVLRERWWVIAACVAIVLVGTVIYLKVSSPTYSATAELEVQAASPSNSILSALPVLHQTGDPTEDVLTAANLVTTPQVASAVIQQLHLNMSVGDLLADVQAVPIGQASFLAVQANASTPELAQSIANAFVSQTIAARSEAMHAAIRSELPGMRVALAQTPQSSRYGAGSLGETIQELNLLLTSPDPTLLTGATAALPSSPSSPKTKLALVVAVIAGLVLGIAAAFAMNALDPRIKREEQVKQLLGVPVLARIRRERSGSRSGPLLPTELSPGALEGYRTLRAALTARGGGFKHRAYLVTGSGPGEGKSTTAINLAAALAQNDATVILIEADLRRPTLARLLGLKLKYGVEQVITDEVDLAAALVSVHFGEKAIGVLAARRSGVDLADKLTYQIARRLLDEARAQADFVVVDSPPLIAVSDALPFAQLADEIIVVARLDHAKRGKLVALDDLLRQHGQVATGIVVVGDTQFDQDYYYGQEEPFNERVQVPLEQPPSPTAERVAAQYGWDRGGSVTTPPVTGAPESEQTPQRPARRRSGESRTA
jgi:receptor protein-tyrosine kinase